MVRQVFTKGTKQNEVFKIVVMITLSYYVLMLIPTISTVVSERKKRAMPTFDFPCSGVMYPDGCRVLTHGWPEPTDYRIDVHLQVHTTDPIHMIECRFGGSHMDQIEIDDYLFQRDGESLLVDRWTVVEKGEVWEGIQILNPWNPWLGKIKVIELENHGIVSCAKYYDNIGVIVPYGPTLMATGFVDFYYLPNLFGILLFMILIGMLVYDLYQGRRA